MTRIGLFLTIRQNTASILKKNSMIVGQKMKKQPRTGKVEQALHTYSQKRKLKGK